MNDFAAFQDWDNSLDGALAVVGRGGGTRFAEMNKGITPVFFVEDLPDDAATEKAGTLKVRSHERVRLITAGDMLSAPVHPVTKEIIERFPDQYDRWKRTRSNDHIDGTPLSAWPQANRGFVMELNALNIRSVEDLAAVSDANISRITDGRIWREKAVAWLATSKDAGAAAKYAAENERLRADVDDLKRQLSELGAQLSDLTERRGPGRPPKQAA